MTQMAPLVPRWGRLALFLLFGLALAFRCWGLGKEPLWLDENFSVRFSDHSVREVLSNSAWDVHPPLYYLGLYAWRSAFGDSVRGIRSYSIVWSLLGLGAVFLLAREIAGPRAGWIALLLGAVNPLDIYFAQEARMYTQTAALGAVSAWLLWVWLQRDRRLALLATYGAFALATLLSHYLGVLILLSQGTFALLFLGARREWRRAAAYLTAALAVALCALPWILVVLELRGSLYRASGLGWIPPVSFLRSFFFLGRELFWGHVYAPVEIWAWTAALAASVIALALWSAWRQRLGSPTSQGTFYGLALLFGPVLLAVGLSAVYHPIYYPQRFAELVVPAFFLLAGIACDALRGRRAWLLAGVLACAMAAGTVLQWQTQQKRPWQGASLASHPPFCHNAA